MQHHHVPRPYSSRGTCSEWGGHGQLSFRIRNPVGIPTFFCVLTCQTVPAVTGNLGRCTRGIGITITISLTIASSIGILLPKDAIHRCRISASCSSCAKHLLAFFNPGTGYTV
eukprot:753020-Rhodomonas_salina.1